MAAVTVLLPRLLGETAAASYLGISATTLRGLGLPRRVYGTRRLYDRLDLDAYADALPYEGESEDERARRECDEAFGCGT